MKMDLSAILPLGDLQYENGTLDKFQRSFDPTWGRLKAQMRPVVGNHEYRTPGAAGYFDYFNGPGVLRRPGRPARQGLLLLRPRRLARRRRSTPSARTRPPTTRTSTTARPARRRSSGCAPTSPPTRPRCTLADWHHPWFSVRPRRGRQRRVQPLFQALYDNGVEVLLTGHDHGYERFAPMDAAANRDPARGVRQFVVGTGGKNQRDAPLPAAQQRGPRRAPLRRAQADPAAERLPVGVRARRRPVRATQAPTPRATLRRGRRPRVTLRRRGDRRILPARRPSRWPPVRRPIPRETSRTSRRCWRLAGPPPPRRRDPRQPARCVEAPPSSAASSCARLNSQCTSASQVKPMPPWSWIAAAVTVAAGVGGGRLGHRGGLGQALRVGVGGPGGERDAPPARPRCRAASARSGARRPGRRRPACRTACGP